MYRCKKCKQSTPKPRWENLGGGELISCPLCGKVHSRPVICISIGGKSIFCKCEMCQS